MTRRATTVRALLAGALLSLALPAFAQNKPITLKITDSLSKGHVMYDITLSVYIPALEEGGKIKVEYFPANQLGKMADVIQTVKSGVADIGHIVPGVVSGRLPVTNLISLPGQATTGEQTARLALRLVEGSLKQEFDRQGIRVVSIMGTPIYQVFTRNKPVRLPSDIKGLKLRGTGGDADDYLRDAGVVVIALPAPQIYESLQKGVIDGALYLQAAAASNHLYEVTKFATEGAPLSSIVGMYFMDQKKFESFPRDIQQIILRAGEKTGIAMGREYDRREVTEKAKFLAAGGTVNVLTPDEIRQWQSLQKDAAEKMLKKMESRGFGYARQVYAEMQKIRAELK